MQLFVFFIMCYGLTMLIVQSVIMAPFREFVGKIRFFRKLFNCMMCTGFWASLVLSIITKYSLAAIYMSLTGGVGFVLTAVAMTTLITFVYLVQLAIENYFKIDW